MNKVILIGRLGQDPELRVTQSGISVCTMSIATSERWTDKGGQKKEETEWHRIIVWDRAAENCQQYLRKGSQVAIQGKLKTRKWQDQNGIERYTTEIVADRFNGITFLSAKEDRQENQQSIQQPAVQAATGVPNNHSPGMDDDIPF